MASVLSAQTVALAGITPSYSAADAAGNYWTNNSGRTFLHVKNGGGGSINVTINSQATCDQGFDHDQVVAVTNGQERMIGPFPTTRWNDANGRVNVSYSGVASVTVGVFEI
jgi:hypothetical protein